MGKSSAVRFKPLIEVQDDGLHIPEVRQWALDKYALVGGYGDIFTSGMHKKWHQLAYVDLFAGAGYARIKESGKISRSSALLSLSLPVPYTHYIFCEEDDKCFAALETRVKRDFPKANVSFVSGDSNEQIDKIKGKLPKYSRTNTLLPF